MMFVELFLSCTQSFRLTLTSGLSVMWAGISRPLPSAANMHPFSVNRRWMVRPCFSWLMTRLWSASASSWVQHSKLVLVDWKLSNNLLLRLPPYFLCRLWCMLIVLRHRSRLYHSQHHSATSDSDGLHKSIVCIQSFCCCLCSLSHTPSRKPGDPQLWVIPCHWYMFSNIVSAITFFAILLLLCFLCLLYVWRRVSTPSTEDDTFMHAYHYFHLCHSLALCDLSICETLTVSYMLGHPHPLPPFGYLCYIS